MGGGRTGGVVDGMDRCADDPAHEDKSLRYLQWSGRWENPEGSRTGMGVP